MKHIHQSLFRNGWIGADEIGADEYLPVGQLRERRHPRHAPMIVAFRQRQARDRRGMFVRWIDRQGVGGAAVIRIVGKIEVEIVCGASGKLRVGQLHAVVRHGDDASRAARERPRRARVEVRAQARAVPVPVLEVPLFEEIGVVGFRCVSDVFADLAAFPNGATDDHLRPRRQALRLAQCRRRVGRLENEEIRGDFPRDREGTAFEGLPKVRSWS